MTTSEKSAAGSHTAEVPEPAVAEVDRVPRFGAATPYVVTLAILVLSTVTWWLIGDPRWSILGARAEGAVQVATKSAIVSCLLFWTIFGHIFTGFTFGNWPFSKLRQPLAGIAQVVVDLVIGVLGTLLFTKVVGGWDPTFSSSAAAGAGYTAAAFIVLIGFYAYAFCSASIGGYPFDGVGTVVANTAQWFMAAFITMVGVLWLVYPNFSGALAAQAPVSLPTAAGWVYSSIVIVIVAAMQWGNWPWSAVANKHLRALTAVVVTLGGGYLLLLVFKALLHGLVPGDISAGGQFPYALEAAELGVCFSLWSLIVGLVFPPTASKSVVGSRTLRTVAVAIAAIVTYVLFMRFFATHVLHFSAITGSYGGNPLLWIDWTILLVLWHSVAFGGHLATRRVKHQS